jgi:hypothetical protein
MAVPTALVTILLRLHIQSATFFIPRLIAAGDKAD